MDVEDEIFRSRFTDALIDLDLTGSESPMEPLRIETPPLAVIVTQTGPVEVGLMIRTDGIVQSILKRGDVASTGEPETLDFDQIVATLPATCRSHRRILETHLGYGGKVACAIIGGMLAEGKPYLIERTPRPFPVPRLTDPERVAAIERSLRRSFSQAVPDP